MRKSVKKKVKELQALQAEVEALRAENEGLRSVPLPSAYTIPSTTAYVSSKDPFTGIVAVLNLLKDNDDSPTHLTITSQYIPPGDDGEASYFAVVGTVST
jgi:hypothetical protein